MQAFNESKIEYADFVLIEKKSLAMGLSTLQVVQPPFSTFRRLLADYDTVMRKSGDDPRVRYLNYSRDFMMGTLDHAM